MKAVDRPTRGSGHASLADIKAKRPGYAGRKEAAATATGSAKRHAAEQAGLVDQALTLT